MDRRVIRTKRAIRNAFAELLTIKDMNDITIKDVAELADINRKTFYNYYSGIHNIVEEIENEIVEAFSGALKNMPLSEAVKNPYIPISKLTAIINSDMDFYGCFLKLNGNANLLSKLVAMLKAKLKESYSDQISLDGETFDIVIDYVFSGMFAVYQSWFNSERKQSIEELSKTISVLCFDGINGLTLPDNGADKDFGVPKD